MSMTSAKPRMPVATKPAESVDLSHVSPRSPAGIRANAKISGKAGYGISLFMSTREHNLVDAVPNIHPIRDVVN
jgi:hypothetical protein